LKQIVFFRFVRLHSVCWRLRQSHCTKAREAPGDWTIVEVTPIVSSQTFDAVTAKRHERAPTATPPRILNSPTLLTGLLKCAVFGAGMTLMTGKYGQYRYCY
jgi:hypothetical protein